jgi:hypothetical protein
MSLRLRDYGMATAYATVDVGDVGPEMGVTHEDADSMIRANTNRPDEQRELWPPEIVFLLGQADVAKIYKTRNFKRIFDLRYPQAESHASVVNWVFSVPFAGGRADDDAAAGPPFRFMIHLRLRRAVYAYAGIENTIVGKLRQLLGEHEAGAKIHAGLGWSDLMVEGHFSSTSFERVIDFIIQVHSLRIVNKGSSTEPTPVLQRILTVFGYREGEAPEFEGRHVTFLRGAPGGYDELVGKFSGTIDILDGKADYMVTVAESHPGWLKLQRELGADKNNRRFLRKIETHLMFFSAEKFADQKLKADLDLDVGRDVLHEKECGCEASVRRVVDDIGATMADLLRKDPKRNKRLPAEQRYAIDNALFLLTATLRDASICCDVRDAVHARLGALLMILRKMQAGPTLSPAEHYEAMWRRLNEWHRLSELFLRQRTVGSYEEILGQTDRSIVYSGGVQKFLYLADQLMKDFAGRVQPIDPPVFATIYDSVKIILSSARSLIRVPTSRIFGFPLIVPDLWHEVAVVLFFLRYGEPYKELMFNADQAEDFKDFTASVADHYADIVVYLHGFRADFHKFLRSLSYGWNRAYHDVPEEVWQLSVRHFLLRAYLVYEFDCVRRLRKSGDLQQMREFADDSTPDRLVDELRDLLHGQNTFPINEWARLRSNVKKEDFSDIHRQLYQPFVATDVEEGAPDIEPFEQGNVVDLADADINALFGKLAHQMASSERPHSYFTATAALVESAAIEYRRRQMTRWVRKGVYAAT